MKLIICEKPSLATNVVKAIGTFKRENGYFITNEHIVSFAFGHLFELKNIYDYLGEKKKWSDIPLPFIPKNFEFSIKKDSGIKKQFSILKKIIETKDISEIINCGDADREGQIIIDIIIEKLKFRGKVTRLWLPEQTAETIKSELGNLKNNNNYISLQNEGYARMFLDWLLGINLTIYATVKKGTLLKCGRVMIPIIKYIYDRDLEIQNFISIKYFQLVSNENNIKLELKTKFLNETKEEMEEKKKELNSNKAIVSKIEKQQVKKQPKKLFSLSSLQSYLSTKHKISFTNSLKIIQKLYENGYLTYPRTNTEYLAENEKGKVKKILGILSKDHNVSFKDSKKIFDDNKIDSHSALIPTIKIPIIEKLDEYEKNVYTTVLYRFISNFLDEETIIAKTIIEIIVGDEKFQLKGEVIEKEGFLKYEPEKIENKLPNLKENDEFEVDFKEIEKTTKPPAKISESSLSNFLKNPFKKEKKENDGDDTEEYKSILEGIEIGTEATRTGIMEKCVKENYISKSKQNFSIEKMGETLIETLDQLKINLYKERNISFSKKLKKVSKNEMNIADIIKTTKEELDNIVSNDINIEKVKKNHDKEIIGICPKCGKEVFQGKTKTGKINYYCSGYQEGCDFTLWEKAKHFKDEIKITKIKAKNLLKKEGSAKFKIKGKDVKLKIKINGKWVNFEKSI